MSAMPKLVDFIVKLSLPREKLSTLKDREHKDFTTSKEPADIFSDGQDQQEAATALAAREILASLNIKG